MWRNTRRAHAQRDWLVLIAIAAMLIAITLPTAHYFFGKKKSPSPTLKKERLETVVVETDVGPVTIISHDIVKIGNEEGRIVIFRDEGFKEEPCSLIVNLWFPNSNDPKIWTSTRFQNESKGKHVTIYEPGSPRYDELLAACTKK